MRIVNIDQTKFNQLLSCHKALERELGPGVAWFADRSKSCLGTISLGNSLGWAYAVLKPDTLGKFKVLNFGLNNFNYYQTRLQLLSVMQAAGDLN